MNLLIVGPPGAGKGTHAKVLEREHGFVHISTGDLLRSRALVGDPIGQEIRKTMAAGGLVRDELVNHALFERLAQADCRKRGVVLDGYPRNEAQAIQLDSFLARRGQAIDAVIELKVDEQTMVERITGRCACGDCKACYHDKFKPPETPNRCDDCGGHLVRRVDDNEATVRQRYKAYSEQTRPVLAHYDARGVHAAVDSSKPEAQVRAAILAAIGLDHSPPPVRRPLTPRPPRA